MQGAAFIGDFAARAKAALDAGCDMVLVCNNSDAAAQVIDSLPSDISTNPRLVRFAKAPCADFQFLTKTDAYIVAQRTLETFYN
jgi:beta-N-acetylhexosaminidase